MHTLEPWGWQPHFAEAFDPLRLETPALIAARVIAEHRGAFELAAEAGVVRAVLSGRVRWAVEEGGERPAVGDWVAAAGIDQAAADGSSPASIRAILPRQSAIVRRDPGSTVEHVLAANVDEAWIVTSANDDFSLRRLERYMTLIWDSGVKPVVVVSKCDLVADPSSYLEAIESLGLGVPAVAVSARDGDSIIALAARSTPGSTLIALGSSGVGKSTLLNSLMGEDVQRVLKIREDDARGRHTTTHRQLFRLPGGVLFIDTPGLRQIKLWDGESLGRTFADIEELASACRFKDCSHGSEPDCAVRAALDAGKLDSERWAAYQKLRREQRYQERRKDQMADRAERRRWKQITKDYRRRTQALKRQRPDG